MIANQFVILWDNKPISIDRNSGGYPYKCDWSPFVTWFSTREKAQEYWDIFLRHDSMRRYQNYKIVEVQFRIVDEN